MKHSASLWYVMKQQKQATDGTQEIPGVLMAPSSSIHALLEAQLYSSVYISSFALANFS